MKRATATLRGEVPGDAAFADLLNLRGQGRCAITLDPADRPPGVQPYQGVVPLHGDRREPLQELSQVLEHYMLQSEQLDTVLVLAADDKVAAGLLIQRMPVKGEGNLGQQEIAFRYDHGLVTCDNHTIYKNGAKEIADQHGKSVSFMAKFDEREGNSCHIHLSLRGEDGNTVFADANRRVAVTGSSARSGTPGTCTSPRFRPSPGPRRPDPRDGPSLAGTMRA